LSSSPCFSKKAGGIEPQLGDPQLQTGLVGWRAESELLQDLRVRARALDCASDLLIRTGSKTGFPGAGPKVRVVDSKLVDSSPNRFIVATRGIDPDLHQDFAHVAARCYGIAELIVGVSANSHESTVS
jgi:hypothetical protein